MFVKLSWNKRYFLLSCFLVLSFFNAVFSAEPNQFPPTGASDDVHLPAGLTMEDIVNMSVYSEGKDNLCSHAKQALLSEQAAVIAEPELKASGTGLQADVTHCFLDIAVNPSARNISGSNTFTVTCQVDGLNSFTVDLRSNMVVNQVKVNDQSASYTRDVHKVIISLDRSYNTGETFNVKVGYSGSPQIRDFGSFQWTSHNGHQAFASASEPWNAHTWWPCVETVKDRFTMDLWFTVPKTMIMASNGLLQGVDNVNTTQDRYRWKVFNPIVTYLVSMACTNYACWTEYYNYPGGSMPVEFYVYPEELTELQDSVSDVVSMIETFSDPNVFGQYPFIDEKYGIAQWGERGGLEHQTITSQGDFFEAINAHELAHQWWGDMIACKTWSDIWLNEGFATYAEALYKEKRPGGSYQDYISHMISNLPGFTGGWGSKLDCSGSVYVYSATSVNNIFSKKNVYQKGAWVLHMLRWVVGDDVFFDILAAYRAAYEGSYASTEDFITICENVYGEDLDWFFDQWVYGRGAPSYRTGWKYWTDGANHKVKLHIEQYQTEYPQFRMPLEVEVVTASGIKKHVLWQDKAIQWYVLDADEKVEDVFVEWNWHTLQYSMDKVDYIEQTTEPSELVYLEVTGPDKVFNCDSGQFIATAYYQNGVTRDVTDSVTWAVESQQYCSISESGLLSVGEFYSSFNTQVNAECTKGSVTLNADKSVSILSMSKPRYKLQNLGTLGGDYSYASGINDSGHVVGNSRNAGNGSHAFLYDGTKMIDLGTLGGSYSSGRCVNDSGQVVGQSMTAGNSSTLAFLYDGVKMTSLGTLGGTYSDASGINNDGCVVGYSNNSEGDRRAFLYDGTEMVDLGTLGGISSNASAINNSGVVVGNSETGDGQTHAFLYDSNQMFDLGTLGDDYSNASGINESGHVVGSSKVLGHASHAFLFDGTKMLDLGTLGGTYSLANSINDIGVVVGNSYIAGDSALHPFVYDAATGMLDLNDLIPPGSGWQLRDAFAVNSSGQIAVNGEFDGKRLAVLLEPVCAPDIVGFEQIRLKKISETESEYCFRVKAVNPKTVMMQYITLKLHSVPENITVLDGKVFFASIPAAREVFSNDTFTVRIDHSAGPDVNDLMWEITDKHQTRPAGDIDNDFTVSLADLESMAGNWLGSYMSEGLRGYWALGDDSGSLVGDLSGYGNDGVLIGSAEYVSGITGRALSFDGDDYVAADTICDDIAGGDFTLSLWVKSDSTSIQEFIASFNTDTGDNKFLIGHPAGNSNLCVHQGSWKYSQAVVFDGAWHHVAFVLDNAARQIELYVDGNNVLQSSIPVGIAANDLFSLGHEYDPGPLASDFYNGLIDDAAIYNRKLTAEQIGHLYSNPASIPVGDVNQDGIINIADLAEIAKQWQIQN